MGHSHGLLMASLAMLGSRGSWIGPADELRAYAQQKVITDELSLRSVGTNHRSLTIGATTKRFFDPLEL